MAEFLDFRQITFVSQIDIEREFAVATRMLEEGKERVRVKLPVVLTVTKHLNKPRYSKPVHIMKAFRKEIPVWNYEDLGCDINRIGVSGSPTIVTEIFEPEKRSGIKMMQGTPEEMVQELVAKLNANQAI